VLLSIVNLNGTLNLGANKEFETHLKLFGVVPKTVKRLVILNPTHPQGGWLGEVAVVLTGWQLAAGTVVDNVCLVTGVDVDNRCRQPIVEYGSHGPRPATVDGRWMNAVEVFSLRPLYLI